MHKPLLPENAGYQEKKAFYNRMLTIYGRKAVLEALQQKLSIYRLHLSESNKNAAILKQIVELAKIQQIEIQYHDKKSLSRISRNSQQDQGVAADVFCPQFQTLPDYLNLPSMSAQRLLALDGITNPQNVGMIIRSACAGQIDGILLPQQGTAELGPLVIKASVGTVFKAPIIRCDQLPDTLKTLQQHNYQILTLSSHAKQSLFEFRLNSPCVFVLGNETHGVSRQVEQLSDKQLKIPMNNEVESLNVAVTAALIAFYGSL